SISIVSTVIAIIMINTFFITSAYSSTFVLGMQTTNGLFNPSFIVKFIWGLGQSAAAAVLLYSGGLEALQTASIVSAFPFVFVLLLMMVSLHLGLQKEFEPQTSKKKVF